MQSMRGVTSSAPLPTVGTLYALDYQPHGAECDKLEATLRDPYVAHALWWCLFHRRILRWIFAEAPDREKLYNILLL